MGRRFRNRVTGLLELILEITATEEWNAAKSFTSNYVLVTVEPYPHRP